jgi:hypothetical protein
MSLRPDYGKRTSTMNDSAENKRPRGTRWCTTGIRATLLGVALMVIGLLGARLDLLGPMPAFMAFGIGLLALLVAVIASIIGLAISKGAAGNASATQTIAALICAAAVLAVSSSQRPDTAGAPPIHDISTDTDNPPAFVAIIPLRADAPNPAEYAGAEAARQQQAAFPELVTLSLPLPVSAVFPQAEQAVNEMGWEIVSADKNAGRIEATATTNWFRFKDDVVIRLRPSGTATAVDVRSKSRVGQGDMGANAARIRVYLDKLVTNTGN